jgi:hypothetical protein
MLLSALILQSRLVLADGEDVQKLVLGHARVFAVVERE